VKKVKNLLEGRKIGVPSCMYPLGSFFFEKTVLLMMVTININMFIEFLLYVRDVS
jgi:hypothetical protein